MKKLLLALLSFTIAVANTTLDEIEASFKEASKKYKLQKQEHNITKLLDISKTLYKNNQRIKELKNTLVPKVILKVEPKEKLQVGDILKVTATTLHKTNEMYEKSTLSFLIYNKEKLLAKKDIEIYEKEGLHTEELKFEVSKPSDEYKICAKFIEDKEYQECKNIAVKELIQLQGDIIVSRSLKAQKTDTQFSPNTDLYLFVRFKNLSGKELQGSVKVEDRKTKEAFISEDFTKASVDEVKKAGVVIPKRFVTPDRDIYAKVSMWADGVNKIEKELSFSINDLNVKLNFPKTLKANNPKKFSIVPGKEFAKPVVVDLSPRGPISIGSKDNLRGTLSAVSKKQESAYIDISITGAKGLKWKKRVFINIGTKQEEYVYKEPVVKKPIKPKSSGYKKIPVGTIKERYCAPNGYTGKCKHIMTERGWKIVDGAFKFYHAYDEKELTDNYDTWVQKGKLGMSGHFKNGKKDGKITHYFGNGQPSWIYYYENGKKVPNKAIHYFANGKVSKIETQIGSNAISVSYSKKWGIHTYYEKIGNAYIKLKHTNSLYVSDSQGRRACVANFRDKKLNNLVCYYPQDSKKNHKVVGEKSIWGSGSNAYVNTKFNPNRLEACTNRIDYQGKIKKCKNDEENIYLQRFDAFTSTLSSSKGAKYLDQFDVQPLKAMAGDSLYHQVHNSILKNKLFIYSNPTKECKDIGKNVEYKFKYYFKDVKNKLHFYEKANQYRSFETIKKMIMKDFAKKYYSKYKKNATTNWEKCHNSVVRFYKQLGYNNAY